MIFWLRLGVPVPGAAHVGFVATRRRQYRMPMLPLSLLGPLKSILLAHNFTTTHATVRARSGTRTATASSSSTKAGSTDGGTVPPGSLSEDGLARTNIGSAPLQANTWVRFSSVI
jgi:hypothetical protein